MSPMWTSTLRKDPSWNHTPVVSHSTTPRTTQSCIIIINGTHLSACVQCCQLSSSPQIKIKLKENPWYSVDCRWHTIHCSKSTGIFVCIYLGFVDYISSLVLHIIHRRIQIVHISFMASHKFILTIRIICQFVPAYMRKFSHNVLIKVSIKQCPNTYTASFSVYFHGW